MTIPNRRYYGGLSFELRTGQGAWLWRLVNLCHHLGIVGAAATEAEAVGEARATIDELSARCRVGGSGCDSRDRATPTAHG